MRTTLNQRTIDNVRDLLTCPISRGMLEPITLNYNAFIDICTAQVEKPWGWTNTLLTDNRMCGECEVYKAIVEGRQFDPPTGITVTPLIALVSRREADIRAASLRPPIAHIPYSEPEKIEE